MRLRIERNISPLLLNMKMLLLVEKIVNRMFINYIDAVDAREIAEEKYFGEYSYKNSMKVGE